MKIWIVSLAGDDSRVLMKAFATKEDAVAEMQALKQHMEKQLRYTVVILEEVDDLLILAYYDESGMERYEKAVMSELTINDSATTTSRGDDK